MGKMTIWRVNGLAKVAYQVRPHILKIQIQMKAINMSVSDVREVVCDPGEVCQG